MYTLHGALGERLSRSLILHFPQTGVELPEMLRPKFRQLVVPQDRQEAINVLPVPGQGRLVQLAGSDLPEPQLRVLRKCNTPIHFFLRK